MKKSESHSVNEFFIQDGEQPFFEVGIHEYATKNVEPYVWRNIKIRIECPEFKLEISLPRKVMNDIMDLVHDVDMLEEKTEVTDQCKPEDA